MSRNYISFAVCWVSGLASSTIRQREQSRAVSADITDDSAFLYFCVCPSLSLLEVRDKACRAALSGKVCKRTVHDQLGWLQQRTSAAPVPPHLEAWESLGGHARGKEGSWRRMLNC